MTNEGMYLISFDLETTGLNKQKDRFVQLGVTIYECSPLREEKKESFSLMSLGGTKWNCRSEVRMHPESIKITGISQQAVDQETLSAADVLQLFRDFIRQKCSKENFKRILVAYNGKDFDLPILIYEAQRLPGGAEAYFRSLVLDALFDVLLAAREVLDATKLTRDAKGKCSYALGSVYQCLLQKPLDGAHSALADAEAVMDVLQCTRDKFGKHLQCLCDQGTGDLSGICNVMRCVETALAKQAEYSAQKMTVLDSLKLMGAGMGSGMETGESTSTMVPVSQIPPQIPLHLPPSQTKRKEQGTSSLNKEAKRNDSHEKKTLDVDTLSPPL